MFETFCVRFYFIVFFIMNDLTASADSETAKETIFDGGNKLQVKRRSKLPIQIDKTNGIRHPLKSRDAADHQVLLPAVNCVDLERSKDNDSTNNTAIVKSPDTQQRYATLFLVKYVSDHYRHRHIYFTIN